MATGLTTPIEPAPPPVSKTRLDGAIALAFMTAGNAIFTLVSLKTGARYTYRVRKNDKGDNDRWFVQLLTGPQNTSDYTYLGMVQNGKFQTTRASKMSLDSTPVRAFVWTLERLHAGLDTPNMEFYHAGRCGRCGRVLTVPESIELGLGPECAGKS